MSVRVYSVVFGVVSTLGNRVFNTLTWCFLIVGWKKYPLVCMALLCDILYAIVRISSLSHSGCESSMRRLVESSFSANSIVLD
jgi:hypothetical protein